MVEVPDTETVMPADLVLLAMGFVSPVSTILESFGVERDARGNARASTDAAGGYATSVDKVYAAGDMRRGQSLVVWAIREGRQAARAIDEALMGRQRAAALSRESDGIARPLDDASRTLHRESSHVTFGYDASRTILNDVSLSFERGKVTAILGGSGCGKTTCCA